MPLIRLAAAATLAAAAGIHLYLWFHGFSGIAWIGPMFRANVVVGVILAIAVFARGRIAVLAGIADVLFMAGSISALVLALTTGLLGYYETIDTPFVIPTLIVEGIGLVIAVAFTTLAAGGTSRAQSSRPLARRPR